MCALICGLRDYIVSCEALVSLPSEHHSPGEALFPRASKPTSRKFLLCSFSMLTGTLASFLFSGRRTSATRMSPAVVTASLDQCIVYICGHFAPYPPACSRQFLAPRPRAPDSQRPRVASRMHCRCKAPVCIRVCLDLRVEILFVGARS